MRSAVSLALPTTRTTLDDEQMIVPSGRRSPTFLRCCLVVTKGEKNHSLETCLRWKTLQHNETMQLTHVVLVDTLIQAPVADLHLSRKTVNRLRLTRKSLSKRYRKGRGSACLLFRRPKSLQNMKPQNTRKRENRRRAHTYSIHRRKWGCSFQDSKTNVTTNSILNGSVYISFTSAASTWN